MTNTGNQKHKIYLTPRDGRNVYKYLPLEVRSSVSNCLYNDSFISATVDVSVTHTSVSSKFGSGFVVFPSILFTKMYENILKTNISNAIVSKTLTPCPVMSCQHPPSFLCLHLKAVGCAKTSSFLSWTPEKI